MPEIPAEAPGQPVQVVMPAGLLPRLAVPLAALGMRVYRLPTADGPTLMIAAELSELRDPDGPPQALTADAVLEAWQFAADLLAEHAQDPRNRRKPRKRKVTRNAA